MLGFDAVAHSPLAAAPRQYMVGADRGTYVFSGSAASLLAGRFVVAGADAFTVSGVSAGLIANRVFAADGHGAFLLTLNPASFLKGLNFPAGDVAFTFTGNPVDFRRNYAVNAARGSFLCVGQPATLITTRHMFPVSGNIPVAGDTLLFAGRKLFAADEVFALNGQNADILAGRRIIIAKGVYLVEPGATQLQRNYNFKVDDASYLLTGNYARIVFSSFNTDDPEIILISWEIASISALGESRLIVVPGNSSIEILQENRVNSSEARLRARN